MFENSSKNSSEDDKMESATDIIEINTPQEAYMAKILRINGADIPISGERIMSIVFEITRNKMTLTLTKNVHPIIAGSMNILTETVPTN